MSRPTAQEIEDIRNQPKIDKAYERSLTSPEMVAPPPPPPPKKPEPVKKMAKGGSASARADGCAQRGKTRGKMV
jgi:hypothetical protein